MPCHCCDDLAGLKRISPAPTIHEGVYWKLEHAYPTSLAGWLVLVLKRHSEQLHDLSRDEWRELADLQYLAVNALNDVLPLEREYTCCFAETEGFKHLHFHLIPKYVEADEESTGTKAFHHLKVTAEAAVSPERVTTLCESLAKRIRARQN